MLCPIGSSDGLFSASDEADEFESDCMSTLSEDSFVDEDVSIDVEEMDVSTFLSSSTDTLGWIQMKRFTLSTVHCMEVQTLLCF